MELFSLITLPMVLVCPAYRPVPLGCLVTPQNLNVSCEKHHFTSKSLFLHTLSVTANGITSSSVISTLELPMIPRSSPTVRPHQLPCSNNLSSTLLWSSPGIGPSSCYQDPSPGLCSNSLLLCPMHHSLRNLSGPLIMSFLYSESTRGCLLVPCHSKFSTQSFSHILLSAMTVFVQPNFSSFAFHIVTTLWV